MISFMMPVLAAESGWVFSMFRSMRSQVISNGSTGVTLALAIASLIVAFKLIRIAYDLMSDEQNGGMGGLHLSQILRPVVIVMCLHLAPTIMGTFDGICDGVTTSMMNRYGNQAVAEMFYKAVRVAEDQAKKVLGDTYVEQEKTIIEHTKEVESQLGEMNSMNIYSAQASAGMMWGAEWRAKREERRALRELEEQKAKELALEAGEEGVAVDVKAIREATEGLKKLWDYTDAVEEGGGLMAAASQGKVIPTICMIIYNALFYIIECFAEVTLCILAMFFPWVLVFSLIDAWRRAIVEFAARYITVSFWKVIAAAINFVTNAAVATNLKFVTESALGKCHAGNVNGAIGAVSGGVTIAAIMAIAGVFALLHVNDIAQAIIPSSGGGGGSMAAAAGGFAGSAASMPGKAATGVKGVVSESKGAAAAKATQAFQQTVTGELGKLTK